MVPGRAFAKKLTCRQRCPSSFWLTGDILCTGRPRGGGDGVRHYWIQYSSLCRLRQQAVVLGSFDTGVPKLDMSTFVNAPWFEDIAPPPLRPRLPLCTNSTKSVWTCQLFVICRCDLTELGFEAGTAYQVWHETAVVGSALNVRIKLFIRYSINSYHG